MSGRTQSSAAARNELGRVLRARYLPALLVVALLAVAGHLALARVLSLQDDGAAAVNVSGRQRMLSQRIALHLVLLRTDQANEEAHRAELLRLVDLMERSQRALLEGDEELGLSATDADAVLSLLVGPDGLDERVREFVAAARQVASEADAGSDEAVRRSDQLIAEARGPLLEELDAVVAAFQRDAEDDLGLMFLVSLGLMIGTLVTVTTEWLVVFRPLARRLGQTTEELAVADTDVVTGLWNRRRLLVELRAALDDPSGPPLWLLFCDLDGFKRVNDLHGHDAGDRVLGHFAERLLESLPGGAVAGRVGGDEFVVVLRGERDEAEAVAAEVVAAARRPFGVAHDTVGIGTSIGLALAVPGDSADTILSRADAAMYAAKRDGKGVVRVFDGDATSAATPRTRLVAELSAAISVGELELRYRSIVAPDTLRVIGLDAILSWGSGRRRGDEVTDLAVEAGLDPVVASIAIEAIRGDLVALTEAIGPVPITLGLTANALLDAAIVELMGSLVDDVDRAGASLVIRVVEPPGWIADDRHVEMLSALRDRGVTLSAGGLGSGPASLVHLGPVPLDVVTVDHTVVSQALGAEHREVAFRAVVQVARSMGVDVIVAGVDDRSTLAELAATGCVGVQGPAISSPMRIEEVLAGRVDR